MKKGERFSIGNRRYIGCKAKLTDWIMQIIQTETSDVSSFCDIFAGTGIVANSAIGIFDKVIINDFLFSNNVIYKAFFGCGEINDNKILQFIKDLNNINVEDVSDNYFSQNYGDKFFDYQTSKKIGLIREQIEQAKPTLTDKEYCVLLASLIYSIDKIANTLGHYESYVKKPIQPKKLEVIPTSYQCCNNVSIYREDANLLAKHVDADIVYIDPPYNSRQYSRFYHLYETLVKWDKPKLYGTAMKPKEENMSVYCSSKASKAFKDLVQSLNSKYIVVSYNNTYHSKSSSSKNKISLDELQSILEEKGCTRVYEHSHQFFNAGKTEFKNHKEILFITKVNEK